MAKKVVATLKTGKGKEFSLVIKSEKSEKTGAYSFKQEIVHNDHIKDFLEGKKLTPLKPKPVSEVPVLEVEEPIKDNKKEIAKAEAK